MPRDTVRPYLITKDAEGVFRVTVRHTRFNSQGYPLVTAEVLEAGFASLHLARTFVKAEYRAEAADIATK